MYLIFECDEASFMLNMQSYLSLVHPDDRLLLEKAYEEAKQNLGEFHLEHRILLSGNKVKHLEVRGQFKLTAEGDLAFAEGVSQDVTERVEHRDALQRLAFKDTLTDLPNRRSLEDTLLNEMNACQQQSLRLAVVLLDLDSFGEVNSQYGAALGDLLLKTLAQRLQLLFNNKAVIARVGGDEFALLFTQLQPEASYFKKLNQLLEVISKPITIEGLVIVLTASVGVTEYPQPIAVAGEQLLRQAQQAVFQAKMLGRGRLHQYDISSEIDARQLVDNLEQIRKALQAGEFVLYYQPKVNMNTGQVFGAEALIRWQKNTGELVPPGHFLPALFNNSLEIELGDWVIRTALAQMQLWKQQGLSLQVSVNVTSLQLFEDQFVEKLSKNLADYPDIPPSALQLEVLESSMLNDFALVSGVMHSARKLGVSFALDDFGTGYSSLAYLKHLPASVLKIDQSFIQEMMEDTDDLSIISGVIGMANAFGMKVIAEGVESIEQGNLLLRLGCEQGQGYGIARPMPAGDFLGWIKHWKAAPSWVGQQPVGIQNLPLIYAEVEHYHWVKQVEQWLIGKIKSPPTLDQRQCKVGIWIDSESPFGLHPSFSKLVSLHSDLHKLVAEVIAAQKLAPKNEANSKAAQLFMAQIKQQQTLFINELRGLIG